MKTIARFDWDEKEIDPSTGAEVMVSHKNDIRWDSTSGGFAMCEDLDAYAQTIEAIVLTIQGELTTRRNYGIPYFSTVFYDKAFVDEWAQAVQSTIADLEYVDYIDVFEYEYDEKSKTVKYRMEVTTSSNEKVDIAAEI